VDAINFGGADAVNSLAAPLSFMFCGIYVAWETVLLDGFI
jgi:hypothetical protein